MPRSLAEMVRECSSSSMSVRRSIIVMNMWLIIHDIITIIIIILLLIFLSKVSKYNYMMVELRDPRYQVTRGATLSRSS